MGLPNAQNVQNMQNAQAGNRVAGVGPVSQLYRPEMMRGIANLSDEEKIKYERGLGTLWKTHDTAAPGSEMQLEAKRKIAEFGRMLVAKVQGRRMPQNQQQQQQGLQAQQGQQGMQQGQQQPTPQQQQQMAVLQQQRVQQQLAQQQFAQQQQQLQNSAQAGQVTPQAQVQQLNPGAANAANSQGGAAPTANSGRPPAQPIGTAQPGAPQQQPRPLPAHILNHLNELQFTTPENVAPADKPKWLDDMKTRYTKALVTMESLRAMIKQLEQSLAENQALSPEDRKKLEDRKAGYSKQHQETVAFASAVRSKYVLNLNIHKPGQNGASTPSNPGQGRPQGGAQPSSQVGPGIGGGVAAAAPANSMQPATVVVNAAIEAAKKQQLAAGGRMPGVNTQPAQQGPSQHSHQPQVQSPATPVQAQPIAVAQAPPMQQSMNSQAQAQPQVPIKIEPGTQPTPIPAPLNTALAAGTINMQQQSAGTPTQLSARIHTPQSATPTTTNPTNPRPYTHAAAVAAVNLASSQPRANGVSAPAATTPLSAPTSGSSVLVGPQPGHPHAHPPQQAQQNSNMNNQAAANSGRFNINKQLPDRATQIPTPVPHTGGIGGTGRPTLSGGGGIAGGVMNQPALQKIPAYQMEGEGALILNKKKLDELVRQVCGGTAEGQEGNLLTPEVEESVLNVADAFVDNVLHQACRNAKERGSKVLEIRDLQLVLERTYNIRIPGYSSEELRTVRKVQPNNAWIKKMSAVQAAKVVPGKGDL